MDDSSPTRRKRNRQFDSSEQEAYLQLWRTYDRLRVIEDELFAAHDLTAQQYNVLRLLRASHPERLPTLAVSRRLVSRAPDITRMVDRLAERGLVDRERPANNRRVVLLGITASGLDLLTQLDKPIRQCNHRQLGHLSSEQLAQLTDLLRLARQPHEDPTSGWRD